MGVVIHFPSKRRTFRRRSTWVLAAGGICAALIAAIGVVLAGQDLLRGAQAGRLYEAAEHPLSRAVVIP